ncbi:MAG: hypothetical protein G8345_22220, partial [Magnetococcales bacterium]|nr:hypothetical protein [Magnetococcales bacterium]
MRAYPPKSFKLQWSDDDINWTDAGSWSNLTWVLGETKLFRLPDVVETPVDQPYLYWRLNFAASMGVPTGKTYWFNISEIEMRATQGGTDQCENGTSDAHNYYSSSYGPGKAFDNSSSSFWGSWPTPDPGPPYWIKYNFTSAVYVREVVI